MMVTSIRNTPRKVKVGPFLMEKNLILLSKTVMLYLPITVDNINKSFSDEIVEAPELADNKYALVEISHSQCFTDTPSDHRKSFT